MDEINETHIAQAKILRVFELLSLLANSRLTIQQLAVAFDTTGRTIYRYIDLLTEIGFQIKRQGKPAQYYLGTDYYPVFISHFREDVWKMKARIRENDDQTRKRELLEQEMEVSHG